MKIFILRIIVYILIIFAFIPLFIAKLIIVDLLNLVDTAIDKLAYYINNPHLK